MGQEEILLKESPLNATITEARKDKKPSTDVDVLVDEDGGVAGVKTFEDILDIVGTSGLWNIMIFMLCCYGSFNMPMNVITYQFLGATPDHWCQVDTLIHANWTQEQVINLAIPERTDSKGHEQCLMYDYDYAMAVNLGYEGALANRHLLSENRGEPIYCYSRDFNLTQYSSTLVTEWDLVCDKLSLYSTTQAMAHLGIMIGSIVSGYLLDLFGRRKVILACTVLYIISAATQVTVPNFYLYILLKTLASLFLMGIYVGSFVLLMELCSLKQRSSVGCIYAVPFALGFMMVPGIAYFVRRWRWLQGAYTLPALPLLLNFWLLPESPRWLMSKGRYEEALKVLSWGANVNKRTLPPTEVMVISMKAIAGNTGKQSMVAEEDSRSNGQCQSNQRGNRNIPRKIWLKLKHVFVLVTTPSLRKRALVTFYCWFAASMVYYGVALSSTNLSADPYLYVILGGVTEIPAYLILWLAIAYLGRKISLIAFFVLCGATIAIIAAMQLVLNDPPVAVLMCLSLAGKLGISAAFHLAYIYTAELFPTKYRSLAVGESSMIARVGSIISPYINDILGSIVTWSPSVVFALLSLMAASLSVFLPETGNSKLIEDAPSLEKDEEKEKQQLMEPDGVKNAD